MISDRKDRK